MVDVLTGVSVLAAMAIAGASMPGGGSAPPPQNAPLLLKVDSSGEQVVIRLVGDSAVACDVRYELEVSGGASGGNHSVNRGTATIRPGPPVTVATVRVGNSDQRGLSARLRVSSCGGKDYADEWHWTKPPHG